MPKRDGKHLAGLFLHIGKLINDSMRIAFDEKGIHFGQGRVLIALLKHGKLTQSEIGNGLNIQPATVTNMVKRMEASGLIIRYQKSSDDRVKIIELTEKGVEAAKFVHKVMEGIDEKIIAEFSHDDLEELKPMLLNVRDNLGGIPPKI